MTRKADTRSGAPSAKAAVELLGRALDEADPALLGGAVHFPYTHLADFRGKTGVQVYDRARFEEAVREHPEGHRSRRTRVDLVTEPLSPTAAIVREEAELQGDGKQGTVRAAHTVVRGPAGWMVVATWTSELPDWLVG